MSGTLIQNAAVGGAVGAGKAQALRSRLQAEKERIRQEISSYPTPIAGCDQQFNYLLERCMEIQRELARLLEAGRADSRRDHRADPG